jgi:hypothetical protein
MWEIVALQYRISEIVIRYISDTILPYYSNISPEFTWLYPQFFDISETQGMLFIATFILSVLAFLIWRLLWKIIWFHVFKPEKYKLILLLNIFYVIPFIYWFIGGRFNILNIFLIFLWSWAYSTFQYIFSHPDMVIDYLTN